MSQQDFPMDNQQPVVGQSSPAVEPPKRKQGFGIYTMMLLISFVMLTLGSIIMFSTLQQYGSFPGSFPWKTTEAQVR